MDDTTYTTYTLPRDGQRGLRFSGTRLAESHGSRWGGKEQNRYYDLAVYQTAAGKFLLHLAYHTVWQGEALHDQVEDFATLEAAVTALEAFNPTAWVEGFKTLATRYPPDTEAGREYSARQTELERGIRMRYQAQVSELLRTLDIVEDV